MFLKGNLFAALVVTWFCLTSPAQAQVDLKPATQAPIQHEHLLIGNRFLSMRDYFVNDSDVTLLQPFFVHWYLSDKPSSDCSTLNFDSVRSQSYLIGYQYIDGLLNRTSLLAFGSKIDLKEPIDSFGTILADGWYCLTSEVNTDHAISEIDFNNNSFTHNSPLCLGSSCPKDTQPTIRLYPNPARDRVTLQLPKEFQSGRGVIRIFDLSGRVVQKWEGDLGSNIRAEITLSTTQLITGMYLLVLESSSGRISAKLEKRQ